MRACSRQHLRRIPANETRLLACPDGAPRVCGHAHANICAGYLLTRFNCWRDPTVLQRFAGRSTPTRSCPSLRKECLPYTKGNPREKSEEPFLLRAGDRAPFLNFRPGVCSPFPSSPYFSVQGSKLFLARCRRKGTGFAPPSSLALIPPSRGANFFLPGSGGWALGLLPLPF